MSVTPEASPSGIEVTDATIPGAAEILTPEALAFVADLQRRFGRERIAHPAGPRGASGGARQRCRPRLRQGDRRRPSRRLGRRSRSGGPRRPARRDHGAGRAEDDDQRAQLGRQGLHGRPRGLALADVGERRRWPGGAAGSRPPGADVRQPGGQGVSAQREAGDPRRPAARLAPHRAARPCRRLAGVGVAVRLRALLLPQRGGAAGARERAVLLPAEARGPGRGPPVERGLPPCADRRSRSPWLDPGNGPHRDDPRRVRDGRDPPRAPRARRRPECRALGLPVLDDQEVSHQRRPGPPGTRPADDDDAVHAGLHGAARPDVPPARRPCDRRDGRLHSVPARRRR